jgi:hypothetical protein
MHSAKPSRFSSIGLAGGLVACYSLPALAASNTAFNNMTLAGLLVTFLFFVCVIAGIAVVVVVAGHYGFKANRVIAERICYSLGAILVVKAASENCLPTTASTLLALLASVLTYYVLMRFKPNS